MKRVSVVGLMLCAFVVSAVCQQKRAPTNGTLCQTGCLLPPTGLVGWWSADGNAKDIQLGNNGTLTNGATSAQGFVNQAFEFDGHDDFVDVPDTPALHAVRAAVTVDAWINPQLSPSGEGWIFSRRDPMISEGISLGINNGGYLFATLQTDVLTVIASSVPVIVFDGKWKHVALTADTGMSNVVLYLNSTEVPQTLIEGSSSPSGHFADVTHLFFGQRQDSDTVEGESGGVHYTGLIDEIDLYNRALSGSEVRSIYLVGAKGKCKGRM
jgi:Concanavalin A-like lectin/glucanases superfamily